MLESGKGGVFVEGVVTSFVLMVLSVLFRLLMILLYLL